MLDDDSGVRHRDGWLPDSLIGGPPRFTALLRPLMIPTNGMQINRFPSKLMVRVSPGETSSTNNTSMSNDPEGLQFPCHLYVGATARRHGTNAFHFVSKSIIAHLTTPSIEMFLLSHVYSFWVRKGKESPLLVYGQQHRAVWGSIGNQRQFNLLINRD